MSDMADSKERHRSRRGSFEQLVEAVTLFQSLAPADQKWVLAEAKLLATTGSFSPKTQAWTAERTAKPAGAI